MLCPAALEGYERLVSQLTAMLKEDQLQNATEAGNLALQPEVKRIEEENATASEKYTVSSSCGNFDFCLELSWLFAIAWLFTETRLSTVSTDSVGLCNPGSELQALRLADGLIDEMHFSPHVGGRHQ